MENGVSQDEIDAALSKFFSGYPSTSSDYNQAVSAGSAKPGSVQKRRDIMRSLIQTDNAEETTVDI